MNGHVILANLQVREAETACCIGLSCAGCIGCQVTRDDGRAAEDRSGGVGDTAAERSVIDGLLRGEATGRKQKQKGSEDSRHVVILRKTWHGSLMQRTLLFIYATKRARRDEPTAGRVFGENDPGRRGRAPLSAVVPLDGILL